MFIVIDMFVLRLNDYIQAIDLDLVYSFFIVSIRLSCYSCVPFSYSIKINFQKERESWV
jgi:hypothetical protein